MNHKIIVGSMLLALMVLLQALRLFVPVSPLFSMFGVGSAINACLLLSVEYSTLEGTILLSVLMPVVAYIQGALLLPVMILPIALVNLLYAMTYSLLKSEKKFVTIIVPASVRFITSFVCSFIIFQLVEFSNSPIISVMRLSMSWPQFITGILGGILTAIIMERRNRD